MSLNDFPTRTQVHDAFHGLFCQYIVGSTLTHLPEDIQQQDYAPGDTSVITDAMYDDTDYEVIYEMASDMAREGKSGLLYSALLTAFGLVKRTEAVSQLITIGLGL